MNPSLGRIRVELAENIESAPQELVDLINENVAPPTLVKADDVYVRTMYVVSDAVNSYGGRFDTSDHSRLAAMLVDSPVMVGHRKDKLPVARTFHAERTERNGTPWVKSYFYWLRSAERATELADNIDGGIYKECSIAFTYRLPECSICGRDIRLCEHEPLVEYQVGSSTTKCHYLYKKLDKLLETSLVYRGANPGTSMSRELDNGDATDPKLIMRQSAKLTLIDDLSEIDSSGQFLVVPRYEGMTVDLDRANRTVTIHDDSPLDISDHMVVSLLNALPQNHAPVTTRLVGLRGKQRCSAVQLRQFLIGQPSNVGRIALLVYPFEDSQINLSDCATADNIVVRVMPHRTCAGADLPKYTREIRTRQGVEIWTVEPTGPNRIGLLYQMSKEEAKPSEERTLTLTADRSGFGCLLTILDGTRTLSYTIPDFDRTRFARGRRFVALEQSNNISNPTNSRRQILVESIGELREIDNCLLIRSATDNSQVYVLRRMRMKGKDGLLFYRTVDQL